MLTVHPNKSILFKYPETTKFYSLSLHDALPIYNDIDPQQTPSTQLRPVRQSDVAVDRKSTRLNSSHMSISYAVFCFKKNICELPFDLSRIDHLFSNKCYR